MFSDERRSIYKRLFFCFTYHRLIVESRKNSLAEVEKNQSWTRVNMLFRMQQVFRGKVPNSFQILLLFNLAKGRHVFFSLFPLPNFQTQRTFFSLLDVKLLFLFFRMNHYYTIFIGLWHGAKVFFSLYKKTTWEEVPWHNQNFLQSQARFLDTTTDFEAFELMHGLGSQVLRTFLRPFS